MVLSRTPAHPRISPTPTPPPAQHVRMYGASSMCAPLGCRDPERGLGHLPAPPRNEFSLEVSTGVLTQPLWHPPPPALMWGGLARQQPHHAVALMVAHQQRLFLERTPAWPWGWAVGVRVRSLPLPPSAPFPSSTITHEAQMLFPGLTLADLSGLA